MQPMIYDRMQYQDMLKPLWMKESTGYHESWPTAGLQAPTVQKLAVV